MASKVEIFNLALQHIGQKRVQLSTEKSKEADACNLAYPSSIRSVLSDHEWNFATRYQALTLNSEGTHVHRYSYTYLYPSNCLRLLDLDNQRTPGAPPIDYEISLDPSSETKLILTNQADAVGRYIVSVQDPGLFTPSFMLAASWILASQIAMPLTRSDKIQDAAIKGYNNFLMIAKTLDSNESKIYKGDETPGAHSARD